MDQNSDKDSDRRQYFRVDDLSQLEYQIVPSSHATLADQDLSPHLKKRARWMEALESTERESSSLLADIAQFHPSISEYFNVMNQKVQILVEALVEVSSQHETAILQHINLSEGGMAFNVQEHMAPHTYLAISVLLRPNYRPFLVIARVVNCQVWEGEGELAYRIAVSFTDINDVDRQTIAKHILRLQMVRRQEQSDLFSDDNSEQAEAT